MRTWTRALSRRHRALSIAVTIAAEIGHAVDHRPVETDGATRAASLMAALV